MTDSHHTETPALPSTALVPVSARHDGWTPARQVGFIEALADTACVDDAARVVGMTAASAYRLRRRADAAGFDAAWSAALEKGLEQLAAIAIAQAIKGKVRKTYYHGELINEEVVHSEKLMMFLLQNGRAALGRAKERQKVAADWDGAMAALERQRLPGEPEDGYRVWYEPGSTVRLTNYPPPHGFNGYENGAAGQPGYHRTLTRDEAKAEDARQATVLRAAKAARAKRFSARG